MSWFVYIIESERDGDFYKGISENVQKRVIEHNEGMSNFTSNKIPWKLICYYPVESKTHAIIEEKRIKKLNRKSLLRIVNSDSNLLKN